MHCECVCGLTVSLPKTKGLVVGATVGEGESATVGEGDNSPMVVEGGEMEMVRAFACLGSKLSGDGEITADEVSYRIAKASKAFGCLRILIFLNYTLSIDKRAIYKVVHMVISVLLYRAETWTLKASDVRRLTTFHNRCVHTILGVSKFYQWQNNIPSKDNLVCIGQ